MTLRAAGPYRLYFATAIQPGAAAKLRGDTELLHGSLRPEVELAGVETGSEASPSNLRFRPCCSASGG